MKKSMFKKIIAIFAMMLVVSFISLIPTFAEEADVVPDEHPTVAYPVDGGNIYFDPDTGAVVDADITVKNVVIPKAIYGIKVIAIGDEAFYDVAYDEYLERYFGINSLVSIVLPDTIKTIGESAFAYCDKISVPIEIPSSVEYIGDSAFEGCPIANSKIPEKLKEIGNGTFRNCTFPNEIILPDALESIGHYAFANTNFSSVVFNDKITSIGYGAFSESHLIHIEIPSSVTNLDTRVFSYCSKLKSVRIKKIPESLGNALFENCTLLTDIQIGGTIDVLTDSMFSGCSSLESVVLGADVTTVPNGAFSFCKSLKYVSMPSVRIIEKNAFYKCSVLTDITMPVIENIGERAFGECIAFTELSIPNVQIIGKYCFAKCENLSKISIPNVEVISEHAFLKCSKLSDISIPNVKNICKYSFQECNSLNGMTLPEGLINIEEYAFESCKGLTYITLPDSLKTLNSYVFSGCEYLYNVNLGRGIEHIDKYPFIGTAVEQIVIPKSLKSFHALAFNSEMQIAVHPENEYFTEVDGSIYSKDLTVIYKYNPVWYAYSQYKMCPEILPSVTEIAPYAFSGYRSKSNRQNFILPSGVKTIGEGAFSNCRFYAVHLPDGVKRIGSYAFSNCEDMGYIIIPSSVRVIDEYAIYQCNNLDYIYIENGVGTIKENGIHLTDADTTREIVLCIPKNLGITKKSIKIGEGSNLFKINTSVYFFGTKDEWKEIPFATTRYTNVVYVTEEYTCNFPNEKHQVKYVVEGDCEVYNVNFCFICNKEMGKKKADALGHTWGDEEIIRESTINEKGIKKRICEKCGYADYIVINQKIFNDTFYDVTASSPFADGIYYCYENGYMIGTAENYFSPELPFDRQTFLTILSKIDGADTSSYTKMSFSDVPEGKWYSGPIEWAYRNGYTAGIGKDANGDPVCGRKQLLSREQLATFLFAYSKLKGKYTGDKYQFVFLDKDEVSAWAEIPMKWAVEKRIIAAPKTSYLKPKEFIDRARVAQIVRNYIEIHKMGKR